MTFKNVRSTVSAVTTVSASVSRPARRLALVTAAAAFVVAFAGLAVVPANAATIMPSATNTGVPAGTVLKVHTGDINVTEAGTVLSGLDIRGLVKINAANVTIKNSIIRGRTMNGSGALINNMGNFSNLVVTDTELFPTVMSPYVSGFYGSNLTATRLDIHNVIDGIHVTGSYSAAVQVTQDRGKVSNFSFTNNYADGGHCTVNIAQKTYGPLLGTIIKDNKFGRDTDHANCAIISSTATTISHARNFYTDGAAVTIRKGA